VFLLRWAGGSTFTNLDFLMGVTFMKTFFSLLLIACVLRLLYRQYKTSRGWHIYELIVKGQFASTNLNDFPLYETNQEEYEFVLDKVNSFLEDATKDVECSLSLNTNEINCLACDGVTPLKPFGLVKKPGLLFFYFEDGKLFRKEMFYSVPFETMTLELAQIKILEISFDKSRSENSDSPSRRIYADKDLVRQKNGYFSGEFDPWIYQWINEKLFGKSSQIITCVIGDFIKANTSFSKEEVRHVLIHKITSAEISNSRFILHANEIK
jgi:hypothetical protein